MSTEAQATGRDIAVDRLPTDAHVRLTGLDTLRGIAAILVLGYHLWTIFGAFPLFQRSYLAVDFFFMLSGFVMTRVYEPDLRAGRMTISRFMAHRYCRLWAPIVVGSCLGLAYHFAAGQPVSTAAVVLGVLLLPDLSSPKPYMLNRPAWSIFFELLANAIHGAILAHMSKVFMFAFAMATLALLAASAFPFDSVALGIRSADFWTGVPRVLFAYSIGVLLCRSSSRLPTSGALSAVLLFTGLLLVPKGLAWDILFIAALCPIIIRLGSCEFGGRFGVFLGALSFPLYAVHYPVLELAKLYALGPIIGAILAVATGLLTALLIDRRMLRAL